MKEADILFPSSMMASCNVVVTDNLNIPDKNLQTTEEDKKPKINILTLEEQQKFNQDQTKQNKIERFQKAYKTNYNKKNQPDGVIWNEKSEKFEKTPDLQLFEKEIYDMMKDTKNDNKNYHAKVMKPEISDQIRKNPERSKEIIYNNLVKKADEKEVMKEYNKEIVRNCKKVEIGKSQIRNNDKSRDKSCYNDRKRSDDKIREKSRDKSCYNDRKRSDDKIRDKSNHRSRDTSTTITPTRSPDRIDRKDSDYRRRKDKSEPNLNRRQDYKDHTRDRDRNRDKSKSRTQDRNYYRDKSHIRGRSSDRVFDTYSSARNDTDKIRSIFTNNYMNHNPNYSNISSSGLPHFNTQSTQHTQNNNNYSTQNNNNNYFSKRNFPHNNNSQFPNNITKNTNTSNLNNPSNLSNSHIDNNHKSKDSHRRVEQVNLTTPSTNGKIDLTRDDDNIYNRKPNDKDLVFNLKVDNINYIYNQNSHNNRDDVANQLLQDLKSISQESHYLSFIKCVDYVDRSFKVDKDKFFKEFISFRDKCLGSNQEVLTLSLFYYVWLYENIKRNKSENLEKVEKNDKNRDRSKSRNFTRPVEDKIKKSVLWNVSLIDDGEMLVEKQISPVNKNTFPILNSGSNSKLTFGHSNIVKPKEEKEFLKQKRKKENNKEDEYVINTEKNSKRMRKEIITSYNPTNDDTTPKSNNSQNCYSLSIQNLESIQTKTKKKDGKKKSEDENVCETLPNDPSLKVNTKKTKLSEKEKKEMKKKIEEKMDNDSKYNIIMKLAHKITDPENQANLKKILDAKTGAKLDKAMRGEYKEQVAINLYETDYYKIWVDIFHNENKYQVNKRIKNVKM